MGVPLGVSDGDLEEKVLKIFEKVGCPIEGNNIETCHRISKTKWKDEREERAEKVGHERKRFPGGQSYIFEPTFVHILSGVMVKG